MWVTIKAYWRLWLLLALMLASFAFGFWLESLIKNRHIAEMETTTAKSDAAQSTAIITSFNKSIAVLATINDAAQADKKTEQATTDDNVIYITKVISTDACANSAIPDNAINRLRSHSNNLRSGKTSTDTK